MASVERALSGASTAASNLLAGRMSPERPRGFTSLPMEIVLLIAQYLSDAHHFSDLAAFARLLKLQWRYTHALQEVLFGRIHIDTYDRYSKLARTLQSGVASQRHYQLAPMIRNISATLSVHPAPGQQPLLAEHLLNLYDQCPQLARITLAGTRGRRPDQFLNTTVGNFYPVEQFSTLQSLALDCPLEPLGLSLLCRLPRLAELHIVGGHLRFQLGDRPPLSGSSLRRLTWGASTPPDILSIKWLFAYSLEVTGGEIILLTRPYLEQLHEQIRDYALQRGMSFHSPPEFCSVERET